MSENSLNELYLNELKDLYSAENQLVKALPKMAKAASSDELRQGFEEHLQQTKEHVQRLEQIFERLGQKAQGKKCIGMEGLVKEGSEVMNEDFEGSVMDAALISAAQRVEHYEMAVYGTVRDFATILENAEDAELLEQTLEEERETDRKLTEMSKTINAAANSGEEAERVEGPSRGAVRGKPRRAA